MIQVSIVVPVFDERENLEPLAAEIRAAMEPTSWTWEVVFVDDASADGSLDVLRRLAGSDPQLRVFAHRRNAGQSAALASGFERARGELIVTLDADLQNDPADIPRLLAAVETCDVVSGIRVERRDSWVRRVSSRVANAARRRLLGDRIADVGCSLKVYRARMLRDVPMFNGVHRFLPALLQSRGARVRELPVNHRPRIHGVAKYGVGNRLWRGIADVLAVRWLQARALPSDNVVPDPPARDTTGRDDAGLRRTAGDW